MQKIYFDNNVARRLMDDPKSWNAIYDQLATRIGRRFQTVQSMYLFLEYLGFRKKQIAITPELMKGELSTAALFMSSDDLAQAIDDILEPNLKQINMEVKQQLSTLQSVGCRRLLSSFGPLLVHGSGLADWSKTGWPNESISGIPLNN